MSITNWTQSGTSMEVTTETFVAGAKSLKINPIASGTKTLTSDRCVAIAGQTYKINLYTKEFLKVAANVVISCPVTDITYVNSGAPDTNYHTQNIAGGHQSEAYRALMKFNFSGVPTGATISDAIFNDTLSGIDSVGDTVFTLYRNTAAFTDTTVDWNDKPVTEPIGLGMMTLSATEANGVKTIDLAHQYVQEMIDGTNNGFTLQGNPEGVTTITTTGYNRVQIGWEPGYWVHSAVGYWTYVSGQPIWDNVPYTYTTTVGFDNKYTFTNTPTMDITYSPIIKPNPDYEISLRWYNHASAGTVIRTDSICTENLIGEWSLRTIELTAPSGSLSFDILISATVSEATFYVDGISVIRESTY
jgi:hypothetical protein